MPILFLASVVKMAIFPFDKEGLWTILGSIAVKECAARLAFPMCQNNHLIQTRLKLEDAESMRQQTEGSRLYFQWIGVAIIALMKKNLVRRQLCVTYLLCG